MHDVHPVQVLDGSSQVEDHGAGITLTVLGGRGDGVEKVAALKTEQGVKKAGGDKKSQQEEEGGGVVP